MPPYQAGDTVYLGNTAFLIEEITDTHVNLRDPTLLLSDFKGGAAGHV